MVPRKAKDILKDTIKELGGDEKLTSVMIGHYWSEIRKALVEMRHHSIYINDLGTFKVKYWKIQERIEKYQNIYDRINPTSFQKMSIRADIEKTLDKTRKLNDLLMEEFMRKAQIKAKRNEQILEKHLAKQGLDSGGNPEQPLHQV